jgi:hypothetical protein
MPASPRCFCRLVFVIVGHRLLQRNRNRTLLLGGALISIANVLIQLRPDQKQLN